MALIEPTPLITTIVLGISTAFVCGMVASKLRLSPIVGYLLAGICIGPYTPGFIANSKIAAQFAELGIVLLMFGVGLHFSLKDLMAVKKIAIPGAIVQMSTATGLGTLLAYYWGWPFSSSLLFGLALSVASTVVLLRALEERNIINTINGHIAIGWLIVEDIAIVLAIVLIPALATGGTQASSDPQALFILLGIALGKIGLFIAIMLIIGKRFLPWILVTVANTKSRELFTLSVFVVAVGIAFGAAHLFSISFALGAFFAGMIIKQSDFAHEVTEKALPFQDAFAVLFFVSVGMLFDPATLIEQPLQVALTLLIIMVGKSIAALAIILLFRYPAKTAFTVSASLAQIGEFSFILGTLGLNYGLLSHEANNLILAAALISITLNPILFKLLDKFYAYASKHPRYSRWMEEDTSTLSHLSDHEKSEMNDFVIIVGYGRVGQYLRIKMKNAGLDFVVVDQNQETVEPIRQSGEHAIVGDARHRGTLEEALIGKARAIVVAVPDIYEAQRIVKIAREMNPNISILTRARNDKEFDFYKEQNVEHVVIGVKEIAARMMEQLQKYKIT